MSPPPPPPPLAPAAVPLAPCVAVTGPPNSGKTTLLHLLDEALQLHPARPAVYVVKGNPDGTGRYLHYSPELRTSLKASVKGRWIESTVDQICEWVTNARRNLELVLLDFGGKHSPENRRMLGLCSHYIVLSRRFADPAQEAAEGAASWREACESNGLKPVAVVESLWERGACTMTAAESGSGGSGEAMMIEGTLRSDSSAPGDRANAPLIDALTARLLTMRVPRAPVAGVDLRLDRDWSPSDLPSLGGLLPHVAALAHAGAELCLHGRAPVWIYLAAMHRALGLRPDCEVRMLDPKLEDKDGVRIPAVRGQQQQQPGRFPADALRVEWRESARPGFCRLEIAIATPDKFLPGWVSRELDSGLPLPAGPAPCAKVVVSGPVPIWLHMAYSRWLRSVPGVETIGVWDARNTTEIIVGP